MSFLFLPKPPLGPDKKIPILAEQARESFKAGFPYSAADNDRSSRHCNKKNVNMFSIEITIQYRK